MQGTPKRDGMCISCNLRIFGENFCIPIFICVKYILQLWWVGTQASCCKSPFPLGPWWNPPWLHSRGRSAQRGDRSITYLCFTFVWMRMLDVFIMFDLINNNLSPFKSEEDDIIQNPVLGVRHSLVSDSVASCKTSWFGWNWLQKKYSLVSTQKIIQQLWAV